MSKHIIVIGGGVIGLSTAYYCARKGHRVTIIERHPEQRDGCSFGNAGMIVPSHFIPLAAPGMVALALKWMRNPESPFYIKPRLDWDLWSWGFKFWRAATKEHVRRTAPLLRDLHFASRACFEELAELPANDFGLVKKGLLLLCKTQRALDEESNVAEQASQLGIPVEALDAKQTARLEPNIRMNVAGSVYFPKDCHLSPDRFMEGFQRQLAALGVAFFWRTDVTGWRVNLNRIAAVRTTNGEFVADEFILCGGAWSSSVARDLGLKLPMQAGKGYSLTLTNPPRLPQICAILSEARVAVTPMGKTLRFGGTMEMAGLNEKINPLRVRGIVNSVTEYYRDFAQADFDGIKPWCGLRPCSPDGLPYLGRTGRFANLVIATGHAMMGLSLGPVSGKIVAELLSGEKPAIGIDLLSPDRFG